VNERLAASVLIRPISPGLNENGLPVRRESDRGERRVLAFLNGDSRRTLSRMIRRPM
jgi:hypothetical protein